MQALSRRRLERKMIYKIKNQAISNASWIIACRIVQSILNLVISMMTARYLGPSNYGVINYAAAVVAFFVPIMQLGFRGTLVQEYIDAPEKEGVVLGTSTVMNVVSALLCVIGVAAFVSIANNDEKETIIVCVLYSIILLFQATEMIQYWFQAKLLSKYTSLLSLCAYIIVSVYKIALLATGKSIYWFAVANAFDYLIISVGLFFVYKKLGNIKVSFSLDVAIKLLSRSKYYIVSSLMVTVFGHIGSVALDLCISKEAVGLYTAAITCAGMTGFVFNAIIDSARPVILSYRQTNHDKYQQSLVGLYSIIIYMSTAQSVVICVLAKMVVYVLYGSAYQGAVEPLRIVVWYTIFSYMGPVRNIWILAEGKQQYLWIINLLGAVVGIGLNFMLIPAMEISGAAIAALGTQLFTNVMTGYIIKPIRECNKMMLRGLNPKNLWGIIRLI